ncbi:MAG: metallophosphoesterase family protein [Candidatus Micrarchaeota archaeon]|nr:metallophosphoesterase family protein [Candidatus Micrarchaeota archaeon]
MRVAILSDFHLGYERFSEDAYRQAEDALNKASAMADMMIIPGDIFDMRNPRLEVLAQGVNLFRNLSKRDWKARVVASEGSRRLFTDVPIIAIPGTHERRAQDAGNSVELLAMAGLLVDASDSTVEIEKNGERVAVFALGGLSEEKVRPTLAQLGPKPISGAFNIFMFHQSIYELLPFSTDFIKFDELPKGFDLYVDGHIHSRIEEKVFGKPFLIPGSTVLTQLKDGETERKGFFIFDTKSLGYEFVAIDSHDFYVERVDVTGKEPRQIQEEVSSKIEHRISSSRPNPIIRIVIAGELKSGYKGIDIDFAELLKRYKEKAIVEIAKDKMESKDTSAEIESLRKGTFENVSVKDYGISIFLEQLKKSDYSLKTGPAELFDILSSDEKKEKIITQIIEKLFAQ